MISFPEMLPDELFYSCCARYHNESGNEIASHTMKDLFGNGNAKIRCIFPSHLNNFVTRFNTKWGEIYNKDILAQHTIYPFFRPFLDHEQLEVILQMINGTSTYRPHFILGIKNNLWSSTLNYCPDCIKADDLKYGFPYWRRLHQVPGMLYCPSHDRRLKNNCPSCIFKFETQNKVLVLQRYCKCGHDLSCEIDRQVISFGEYRAQKQLIGISKDITYLINSYDIAGDQWSFRQLYKDYLSKTKYSSLTGRLNQGALANDFMNFYSIHTLELLQCELSNINWIQHFFNNKKNVNHPLKHVLFIRFLFGSISNFIQEIQEAA